MPSHIAFPFNIDIKKAKTEEKKRLEIDIGPNKIKPGEVLIVCVEEWWGLKKECFAVQNVDGKHMIVQELKLVEAIPRVHRRARTLLDYFRR